MKIDILLQTSDMDEMKLLLKEKYNQEMNIIKEKGVSLFEQYHVRPTTIPIPGMWKYRIVVKNGIYSFGELL